MSTGMFFSNGAVREVLVHRVEAREHVAEVRGPIASIVDRPIAESIE